MTELKKIISNINESVATGILHPDILAASAPLDQARQRLNDLSNTHTAAMKRVLDARIELDDAEMAERKAEKELQEANEKYVELEKAQEASDQ